MYDGLTRKQEEVFDHIYGMYRNLVRGSPEERLLLQELRKPSRKELPRYIRVGDRPLVFRYMLETLTTEFNINDLVAWFNVATETIKNWKRRLMTQKFEYGRMSDFEDLVGTA